MRVALALAARGLGRVAPNPAVGCVIVKDSIVLGRGWTQPSGRPHAETEALKQAGQRAKGATAYVTLEPCSHYGQTPPCCDALIAAGITRCVIATGDPDERVSGSGVLALRDAGITVEEGLCAEEAVTLNEGFFRRIQEGRPLVTLKLATTLDGKVATADGDSQWITGPQARAYGHLLRAQHDAILTGIGTVLEDDPHLTCRLPGLDDRSPIRVVLDSQFRTPLEGVLVQSARHTPVWVLTTADQEVAGYSDAGVNVISCTADEDGRVDLNAALAALGTQEITRVMVECGPVLAGALLELDLVDRIVWFRSPSVLGGDGLPVIDSLGIIKANDAMRFTRQSVVVLGEDVLETYSRTPY